MPTSTNVPLCTRTLSSGKACGSPALRNEKLRRHHIGRHRITERERFIRKLTERLIPELEAMTTPQLLRTFYEKLERLQHTLKKYPDVYCALAVTMARVHEIAELERSSRHQAKQNEVLLRHIQQTQVNSVMYREGLRIQSLREKANSVNASESNRCNL